MTADENSFPTVDAALARRLVDARFPQWAHLPLRPVDADGHDHRTFHLEDELGVRLPSAPGYGVQARKEARYLPVVAAGTTPTTPEVVGVGAPDEVYPLEWSVRRWIPGVTVRDAHDVPPAALADDLAAFLRELRSLDPAAGPAAGEHSAGRGLPLQQFDDEVREALDRLGGRVDVRAARALWDEALAAPWSGRPTWFHGDVAEGNLLTSGGHLSAVIDFGCCGVGDPACDLVLAWTWFSGAGRERFRRALEVEEAEWRRGVGWALWKALVSLDDPVLGRAQRHALGELGLLR